MDAFLSDVSLALRRLRRSWTFSTVVVLVLGLGLGMNATVVSIVSAFLWRPLPLTAPEELVAIASESPSGAARPIPLALIDDISSAGRSGQAACGYATVLAPSGTADRTYYSSIAMMTDECPTVLGVTPALGRWFTASESPVSGKGAAVAVLGHSFWQRAFGGDPSVLGRPLTLDATTVTVIGVLPESFSGLGRDADIDVATPFNTFRPARGAQLVVMREPGADARKTLESQLWTAWPSLMSAASPPGDTRPAESRPAVEPFATGVSTLRNLYGSSFVNIAVVTSVLALLAALNASGLLAARMAWRLDDVQVMRGLGASTWRLARPIAIETLLLASAGAALALVIAQRLAPLAVWLLPVGNVPWTIDLAPDWRVVAVVASIAVLAAAIAALIPMVMAMRASTPWAAARRVSSSTRPARLLVVLQAALTVVVLIASGLLVRSWAALDASDRGYRHHDVLSFRVTAAPGGYADLNQPAYYAALAERVGALPGVSSVGLARYFGTVPDESTWYQPVAWPGEPVARTEAVPEYVSPGFLGTVGIPLLAGRDVRWTDRPDTAPVAIVSARLARSLDAAGDVLGRRVVFGPTAQEVEIVGVAGDASLGNSRVSDLPLLYLPGPQAGLMTFGTIHVRSSRPLGDLAPAIRSALADLGKEQIVTMSTLDRAFGNWLVTERMAAVLGSGAAGLALTMSAIGLYSLLAFAVARRTREIGVRVAVGASLRDVALLVIRDAARLLVYGLILGGPAGLAAAQLLRSFLFGITPSDPGTMVGTLLALAVVGVVAALGPALRALRVDPATALRSE